jgi:hypothetical protein
MTDYTGKRIQGRYQGNPVTGRITSVHALDNQIHYILLLENSINDGFICYAPGDVVYLQRHEIRAILEDKTPEFS